MAQKFTALPASGSVRRINFTRAVVRPGFVPNTYFLVVWGTKPCINMLVELSPLVYIQQPDYWGIEVVGSLPGFCLPATAPYVVSIPLDGIIGKKGIEVIGATKRKRIPIPSAGGGVLSSKKSSKSAKKAAKKRAAKRK
jgi:hypothetical protein